MRRRLGSTTNASIARSTRAAGKRLIKEEGRRREVDLPGADGPTRIEQDLFVPSREKKPGPGEVGWRVGPRAGGCRTKGKGGRSEGEREGEAGYFSLPIWFGTSSTLGP